LGKKSQRSLGKPIDDARQNTAGLPDSGRPKPRSLDPSERYGSERSTRFHPSNWAELRRKAAEPVALPPSVHRLLPFRALPSAQTISQNSLHFPDGPDLPAMVLIDAGPRFLARASFA